MKPDTAEELDSLAGEFVLGTLSPQQHATVAERLVNDTALRAAVNAWEARLLELTALAAPQPPSARLWGRIQRSLNEMAAPATQQQVKWWRRLGLWHGLSAAGLAASAVLAFTLLTAPPPTTQFVVVLVAPNSQTAGWVVQTSDSRMIELIPLGQDAVPEGMALQFWTKGEQWQAPVSLGLVKPGEPYRVPLQSLPPLEANQLFELTLEKSGGSPTGLPTGPVKFIGRAVKVI
ncbi:MULTISPECIES: anti-sigma factor domain-containing protein [Pseudomonas]|uniref:RNA polymerase subunit sigma-70 n=2 Tax=Pseudomonas putida group TaxID=136845 RepID=A0AAP7KHY6_9PSED|nr:MULTISPECIES: anti-sigma factor [Pseudomonas]AYN16226.1 RNA polymerase subunit sigma-70 [Pseudomonas monteilii]AYO00115.1 RNA polymerase subunit sigma-70 [Pseudomonas sp. LTGT-11-2Z]KPM59313.1 RNA polymerase subunit sigma-70 [Pseudomonas putida]MBA1317868.1 RNA polymerase subunit sigma-70 [Pseudomonas monteilii]MBA6090508.1 anti-sigma factor [Pseudomonas monteilii]